MKSFRGWPTGLKTEKYSAEMLFYFASYPKEAQNKRQSKKNRPGHIGRRTFPPLVAQEALFKIQMNCFNQIG